MAGSSIFIDQLLRALRLRSEIYHNARVCGDWVIPEGEVGQTCFHLVVEGDCLLHLPGKPSVALSAGDLVFFPREIPHTMTPSSPQQGQQQHLPYSVSGVTGTGMLCGRLLFEHRANSALLDAMPEMLVLTSKAFNVWLPALVQLIQTESYQHSGESLILDRIGEIIFIYILKEVAQQKSAKGILALYHNIRIAAALEAIHNQPEKPWTLNSLARLCNMSRTNFARVFSACDWTPVQYLTWWRMQLAYAMLEAGETISNTAEKIGYKSEAAFSRAFFNAYSIRPGWFKTRQSDLS